MVSNSRFRIRGLRIRVWLGVRVYNLGYEVYGL
jgi:hypothetical protein